MLAQDQVVGHRAGQRRVEQRRRPCRPVICLKQTRVRPGNWTSTIGSSEQRPMQPTLTTSALISWLSRYAWMAASVSLAPAPRPQVPAPTKIVGRSTSIAAQFGQPLLALLPATAGSAAVAVDDPGEQFRQLQSPSLPSWRAFLR